MLKILWKRKLRKFVKEMETVTTIVPKCAIEEVLVNKIMHEYPCKGGLTAYALEKEVAV